MIERPADVGVSLRSRILRAHVGSRKLWVADFAML